MEGILVFNLGIDSIKGTLYDESGTARISAIREIKLYVDEEIIEQDPEEWYQAVCNIISELANNEDKITINSITATYRPGTFVCIDSSGRHIMNAIVQCDSRSRYQSGYCEKNIKRHNDEYHIPWEYMILPKISWIKNNRPDIYNKIFKILTPDGYLAYRLCGETAVDSLSALFMGYNIKNLSYNTRVISEMGLDDRMFPEVRKSGECIGIISGDAKDKINLESDINFLLSSNAIISMSMMCSRTAKGKILFDADSSIICFQGDFNKIRRGSSLIRIYLRDDNRYIYGYMGNYESQFLKWIKEFINEGEELKEEYIPGSNGLMLLPYIMGDNLFNNTDMRGSITGININTKKRDIVSACYESIGYVLRNRIDHITYSGMPVDSIEVICSIKDELFYQILSNITAREIIISDIQDCCIKGAYLIAVSKQSESESEKTILSPDPDINFKYRQFMSLYRDTLNSLEDVYRHRRRILKRII